MRPAGPRRRNRRSARSETVIGQVGALIYIIVNLIPILLATFAGLIVGTAYRAVVPRDRHWRTRAPARGAVFPLIVFLAELWLAAILAGALILAPTMADAWTMSIGTAIVIWIGFVVPAVVVTDSDRAMPARTTLFDCGYWLVVMATQAAVMTLTQLVPPPV